MASTVNVPVFGQVSKGKLAGVLVGGAAVSGFLIYRRNQKNKKQQAAAASAAAQAASAYGYGASQGSYGYGMAAYTNNGYYGYGASGGFNATGYYGYGLTSPPSSGTPAVANTTNAQWEQAAINQLSQDGYDRGALAAALGAYDVGAVVTGDQQGMIQAAIGIEGYPPVPGKNGFPPSINVQGTPGGGTGGGQSSPPSGGDGGDAPTPLNAMTYGGPQLMGKTAAQVRAAVQSPWFINNQSGNVSTGKVVSFTPYSDGSINIGYS